MISAPEVSAILAPSPGFAGRESSKPLLVLLRRLLGKYHALAPPTPNILTACGAPCLLSGYHNRGTQALAPFPVITRQPVRVRDATKEYYYKNEKPPCGTIKYLV